MLSKLNFFHILFTILVLLKILNNEKSSQIKNEIVKSLVHVCLK